MKTVTPRGYMDIKELAKRAGTAIPNLLALSRNNDPFFVGTKAHRAQAEWFVDIWQKYKFGDGVHLRRIHYQVVSQAEQVYLHNGKPYQNTESCWGYMTTAAKYARILGLVEAHLFVDKRNPDPHILADGESYAARPEVSIYEPDEWELPKIDADLGESVEFDFRFPVVDGYDYDQSCQPYLLEVWIEKSTMNSELFPICRSMGANLVTSIGFQSITAAVNLLQRAKDAGKPARVFYISDFDPAGDGMPVAVSRQLEYWREIYAPEIDVKLTPLLLTKEQVREYRLPRIPIKDSDLRKEAFEDRYGEGAVELDAMEAIYPGELAGIVQDALRPYVDEQLETKLDEAREMAEGRVRNEWWNLMLDEMSELAAIRAETEDIVERYSGELESLNDRLQEELEPIRAHLEDVWQAVQAKSNTFEIDLPPRPEPETDPAEKDWLFDSKRGYMEQLSHYQERKKLA